MYLYAHTHTHIFISAHIHLPVRIHVIFHSWASSTRWCPSACASEPSTSSRASYNTARTSPSCPRPPTPRDSRPSAPPSSAVPPNPRPPTRPSVRSITRTRVRDAPEVVVLWRARGGGGPRGGEALCFEPGARWLHVIVKSCQNEELRFLAIPGSTAKSMCPNSIQQRKGPGTKSISVIAIVAWYKINFIGLHLYRNESEPIRIPGFVPFHFFMV